MPALLICDLYLIIPADLFHHVMQLLIFHIIRYRICDIHFLRIPCS